MQAKKRKLLVPVVVITMMVITNISTTYGVANAEEKQENITSSTNEIAKEVKVEPKINEEISTTSTSIEDVEVDNGESEEFKTLCMLTYAESGLEPLEGQIAVAATILNRIEDSQFPDTFDEVIHQKGAFSSVKEDGIYLMTEKPIKVYYEDVSEETKEAVRRALAGEDPTEDLLREETIRVFGEDKEEFYSGGALFFCNIKECDDNEREYREGIQVKNKIGKHTFYKIWG